MNVSYSRQLRMHYVYNDKTGTVTFSDGILYTIPEMMQLVNETDRTIHAVHAAKSVFNGEIVTAPDSPESFDPKIDDTIRYREKIPCELKQNNELDYLSNKFSGVKILKKKTYKKESEKWRNGDITEKELQLSLFPF